MAQPQVQRWLCCTSLLPPAQLGEGKVKVVFEGLQEQGTVWGEKSGLSCFCCEHSRLRAG